MKILNCPINGPRPLQEFTFGGEVRPMPDPAAAGDDEWADYVFNRDGEPAVKREWWYHIASGTWFIAERDNRSDEIVRTYLYGAEAGKQVAGGEGGGGEGETRRQGDKESGLSSTSGTTDTPPASHAPSSIGSPLSERGPADG